MVHQTLFLFAVVAFFVSVAAGNNGNDLYAILGISNKQAYPYKKSNQHTVVKLVIPIPTNVRMIIYLRKKLH